MERRKCPRIEVSLSVLYFTDIYPRPKVATTVGLSLGGTRIETPYSLLQGERLQISIAIRPEVVQGRGQVVHLQRADGESLKAGVRFEEMPEKDRLYLGQYISHLMEQRA